MAVDLSQSHRLKRYHRRLCDCRRRIHRLVDRLFSKAKKPNADIVLIEAQRIGHGASGWNGGWLMGTLEGLSDFADGKGELPQPRALG